jgi:hypothetical protein
MKNERALRRGAQRHLSEARTEALDEDENGTNPEDQGWGKQWNWRTMAGHKYRAEVLQKREQLITSGEYPKMSAYQPALTAICDGLSDGEKETLAQQAKSLNEGVWPREMQIE